MDKRETRSIRAVGDTDSITISGIPFVKILEKQAWLVRDFWTSLAGKETGVRNSCKTWSAYSEETPLGNAKRV